MKYPSDMKCERCKQNPIDVELGDAANPGSVGTFQGTTKCEECLAFVCDQDCVCKECERCKSCCLCGREA